MVEDYVFDNMDRLDLMQHFQSDSNNADLTDNALKNMFDYSYRADGKRVGLVERFDTSGSGIRPGSSTLTNSYTWAYDNAGRLVSEVLDSSDNSLDQTESFLMDLVGNRMRRTLDKPGTANDTTDIYTYDASDRILNELRYSGIFTTSNPAGSPTQTTTYTWNATQQTSKTVSVPSVSSVVQFMSYGLSGQLERVMTTTQDGNGQTTDHKQVEYRYDPQGIRFIASDYAYNDQTATFTLATSTEYLIDHANFTGYQQTIIETTKNAAGQTTKRISYTYGLDEITQTTTAIDPASGLQSQASSLTFAHDGHGSTRVLFEAAAVIAQVYTYSAYGELLALHNSLGSNLTSQASPLTSVLYNGESLDPTTGLYNFRARWYSASNGRFERLDPFAGNPNDPFSFNKYGFVHGNPVMGTDPTGLFEASLSGFFSANSISIGVRALKIQIARSVLHGGLKNVAWGVFKRIALNAAEYYVIDNHVNQTVEALVGLAWDLSRANSPTLEWTAKNINYILSMISFIRRAGDVSMVGGLTSFASANPDFPGSTFEKWTNAYSRYRFVTRWGGRAITAGAFLVGLPILLSSLNTANQTHPQHQGGIQQAYPFSSGVILTRVLAGSVIGSVPGVSVWLPDIINAVRTRVRQDPAATVSDAMQWLSDELQRTFPFDLAVDKEIEDDEEL